MSKPSLFQTVVALLVSLSLVACTSMRPIPATDRQAVRAALKVGDEVSVSAVNGKTYLLMLTAVDDERIVGTGDNKKVTIRYEQIKSIEVRRISRNSAIGATAGLTALYIALGVLTVIVIGKAFKGFGEALGQIACLGLCDDEEDEEAAQN